MGNKFTKADVMLSFGSECTPRNGNNEPLSVENNCVVDVFLNKSQALDLYNRLGKVLKQEGVVTYEK